VQQHNNHNVSNLISGPSITHLVKVEVQCGALITVSISTLSFFVKVELIGGKLLLRQMLMHLTIGS